AGHSLGLESSTEIEARPGALVGVAAGVPRRQRLAGEVEGGGAAGEALDQEPVGVAGAVPGAVVLLLLGDRQQEGIGVDRLAARGEEAVGGRGSAGEPQRARELGE